ncbi:MAG: bifunctional riboflavin kinase/FAD synthetase [Bacteroidota bacterium]
MKIFRDLGALPTFNNAGLTIGSYDGVHIGHQQIIKQIIDHAREVQGETVLITFEPHPRLVLQQSVQPGQELRLLTDIHEKSRLLETYGVDNLIITPFTRAFASQSPEAYIEDFLVRNFQPKRIVIGYDHKFGKARAGDIGYLKKFETVHGFKVHEIQPQTVKDIAVSSTKIRTAILEGDAARAHELLGHPFSLGGQVVRGKQKGRSIGFPTANIAVDNPHKLIPADGVYAVRVRVAAHTFSGMLYIGKSLTNQKRTIEVNIFDFDRDIYEQDIRVDFYHWVRGDQRFDGLPALKGQLARDQAKVLELLEEPLKSDRS